MTNREEFEKHAELLFKYGTDAEYGIAWSVWQACAKLKDAEIAALEKIIKIKDDNLLRNHAQCRKK